ncbi:Ume1p NDAI_0E02310 [Naumovozyma dairenensis CBS 421]|uniref:Uncharacterized protein n=1 Tax=Naumovozyma dairenensis (strain ATCC 10597 / BCRC 20456 / CBS 421 / NBRC 0211 / NRRL Y-12639) TaxID=1071378 RepID=G0WBC8_NAUDC|nr:hypothetical protein NDAI_0E02310 [Naumovozyma dairenensis CBS 421]CCD25048.1 hypothetical protein NDAI_0E02310 [Naumovozyma dairenensis CBS 421]
MTYSPTMAVPSSTIIANKVKNEEFKIWKKTVPSLYQHISNLKPEFAAQEPHSIRTISFIDELVPNVERGILTVTLLYTQSDKIFKVRSSLPLGAYVSDLQQVSQPICDPNYYGIDNEPLFQYDWIFKGEDIIKLVTLDSESFVALTANGSLGWFTTFGMEPTKIITDETCTRGNGYDFTVSRDKKQIIKTSGAGDVLKMYDIVSGELLKEWKEEGSSTQHSKINNVQFVGTDFVGACYDDCVKFWHLKSEDKKPKLILKEPSDIDQGNYSEFAMSPLIDTLFITGTNSGVIKVWDLRTLFGTTWQDENKTSCNPIAEFIHFDGEAVIDLKFSPTDATNFLTVGSSGQVYHWSLEGIYSMFDSGANNIDSDENKDDEEHSTDGTPKVFDEDLQNECLLFLHTGGFNAAESTTTCRKNMVVYQESIPDLIAALDRGGLLTVYKPFTGKI